MKPSEKWPAPWLDDPGDAFPPELRHALQEAREDAPAPELLARVALALGLPPDGPGGGSAPPSPESAVGPAATGASGAGGATAPASTWIATPWVKWAAIAVLGGGGVWLTLDLGVSAPRHAAAPAEQLAPSDEEAEGPPTLAELAAAPTRPAPVVRPQPPAPPAHAARASTRPVRARERARPKRDARTRPPTPVGPAGPTELELLEQASRELVRRPTEALALARRSRQAYPRGTFVQEREVILVQALVKLRRHAQAIEAATAFVDAYPESPYRDRVNALRARAVARSGSKP